MALENEINASILASHTVIATGGSAIYGKEAMEHFKENGKVVYLKLPYGELAERLGDLHERGVVLKPGFTLKDLYDERVPLYERYADITLDCSNKSIRQVMEEIKSKYE